MKLADALRAALADDVRVSTMIIVGANVVMVGTFYDISDGPRGARRRTLPGGGERYPVTLTGPCLASVLAAEAIEEAFLDAFDDAYGFRPEVVDVEEFWLWPVGETPPSLT